MTAVQLWQVIVLAACFGLLVGRFLAVPAGTLAWAAYVYLFEQDHSDGPQLEGDLGLWVAFALVAIVAVSIFVGVLSRAGVRRVVQRQDST